MVRTPVRCSCVRVVCSTPRSTAPSLSAYKAFYRMMAWKTGQFSLEHLPPDAGFDNEINEIGRAHV